MSDKPCIDCARISAETGAKIPNRKPALKADGTPVPGNRCWTHEREKKKERRASSRERNWIANFGITAAEYQLIYKEQGGVCFICQRAKGIGKRALAVEHDHKTGMIRGLACLPCNFDVLGHARDEIAFFERAIQYLTDPPAVRAIGVRIVPNFEENQ